MAMYRVTRTVFDIRPAYDVEASSPEEAIRRVEAFLGGPFSGLESVREITVEEIRAEQVTAGYTPR